jgi:hypothetical protein
VFGDPVEAGRRHAGQYYHYQLSWRLLSAFLAAAASDITGMRGYPQATCSSA